MKRKGHPQNSPYLQANVTRSPTKSFPSLKIWMGNWFPFTKYLCEAFLILQPSPYICNDPVVFEWRIRGRASLWGETGRVVENSWIENVFHCESSCACKYFLYPSYSQISTLIHIFYFSRLFPWSYQRIILFIGIVTIYFSIVNPYNSIFVKLRKKSTLVN